MIDRINTKRIFVIVFAFLLMIATSTKTEAKTTTKAYTYYKNKKVKTLRYYTKRNNNTVEQVVETRYNAKGKKFSYRVSKHDAKGKRRVLTEYRYRKNKKVKYKVYYYYNTTTKSKNKPTLNRAYASNNYNKKGKFTNSRYYTKGGAKAAVVKQAKKQVGRKYRSGGKTPSGFDCSGLTSYVYKTSTGKNIGRASYNQTKKGKKVKVSKKSLQPGDVLFWGSKSSPYHVGIYVGNGKYVHASTPRTGVEYNNITKFKPSYAKRMI